MLRASTLKDPEAPENRSSRAVDPGFMRILAGDGASSPRLQLALQMLAELLQGRMSFPEAQPHGVL